MNRKVLAIPFVVLGVIACAVGLMDPRLTLAGVAIGVVAFFWAGTLAGKAFGIARSLRPLLGQPIRVEVWGAPLGMGAPAFQIDRISAFGAGLLIHLHAVAGGPGALLKVAQPGAAGFTNEAASIQTAAYVSYAGQRIRPVAGAPALVLRLAAAAPLAP